MAIFFLADAFVGVLGAELQGFVTDTPLDGVDVHRLVKILAVTAGLTGMETATAGDSG